MSQVQLDVKAGSVQVMMQADDGVLVGGNTLHLKSPDGKLFVKFDRSLFPFIKPGQNVILTLGLVRILAGVTEESPIERVGLIAN